MASPPCAPSASAAAKVSSAPSSAARRNHAPLYFPISAKPKKLLLLSTKGSELNWSRSTSAKSQLNEVIGSSSNDAAPTESKPEIPAAEEKDAIPPMSEEAISEFMTQAASLVKLVDSRDIIELQLKQPGCELIIRKKEALPQFQQPAPVIMMHSAAAVPSPAAVAPQLPPATSPAPPPPASPPKSTKSSHPPLKSPMAGTFYRSPGPGLPQFVKPGDKINKGQVLCIIEAMKLMNEIEADQSGTVVEILVEDGKPVGVEQPLFVIEP